MLLGTSISLLLVGTLAQRYKSQHQATEPGGPLLPCTLNLKWLLQSIITHVHLVLQVCPRPSLWSLLLLLVALPLSTRLYSGAGLCYARLLVTHLQKSLRYNHHSTHFTSPSPPLPSSFLPLALLIRTQVPQTHTAVFPKEVPDLFSVPCLVHLFLLSPIQDAHTS